MTRTRTAPGRGATGLAVLAASILLLTGCSGGDDGSAGEGAAGMAPPAVTIADALQQTASTGMLSVAEVVPADATGVIIACPGDTLDSLAESAGTERGRFKVEESALPAAGAAELALLFEDANGDIVTSATHPTDVVDLCRGEAVASIYVGSGAVIMLSQIEGVWQPVGLE